MASRKDFVALEQALAAASVAVASVALEQPDISPTDFAVSASTLFCMVIGEELGKVNPAFDLDIFITEIKRYMEIVNGQSPTGDRSIPEPTELVDFGS